MNQIPEYLNKENKAVLLEQFEFETCMITKSLIMSISLCAFEL